MSDRNSAARLQALPFRAPYDFAGSEGKMPVYALAPGAPGRASGFAIWDFRYHDGVSVDHERPSSAAARAHALPHSHPHFEIFWIRRGSGLLALDCELIEAKPRTLLVIGPGDIHVWQRTDDLQGTTLSVSEAFTSESNFSLPFRELTLFLKRYGSRALDLSASDDALVQGFLQILHQPDPCSSFDRREVLKALLLILFSKMRGFYAGTGSPRTSDPAGLTRRFEQALQSECPRLATVKEFADFLKVSRSYLHRVVLRDTGSSPCKLIRERLVFESKRLLLHTSETPLQIAQHLGFRNAAYFAMFFKRHTSQSPKDFRSRRAA
jgi:AraC-like DNA-binding protein/mannose-6-phosphate isomerase-like protein (cupin superfamily)